MRHFQVCSCVAKPVAAEDGTVGTRLDGETKSDHTALWNSELNGGRVNSKA